MGRPRGWAAAATGRPPMRSPGRPPVARREHRQRFWQAIALGLSSEDAAVVCGVSQAVGTRWFRESGGMPSIKLAPLSGRYLSFAEREEIAVLKAQGWGCARSLVGSAVRRRRRPKVAKLAANQALRQYVQDRLAGLVTAPDGTMVPGPDVRWIVRR